MSLTSAAQAMKKIRISWYIRRFFVALTEPCLLQRPAKADSTNHPMMSWPYLGDFLEQTVRYPSYPTLHGKLKNNVYQRGVVISHSEIHWWYSICITIMVGWTWKPPGSSFSSVLAIFRHTCQTLGDRRVAQTYGGFHTWMIPSINGWFKKWMII